MTASDLVTNQRDSLIQRKELAQKTKDFKKLDDAGKLAEIKGLLKGTYLSPLCSDRAGRVRDPLAACSLSFS